MRNNDKKSTAARRKHKIKLLNEILDSVLPEGYAPEDPSTIMEIPIFTATREWVIRGRKKNGPDGGWQIVSVE